MWVRQEKSRVKTRAPANEGRAPWAWILADGPVLGRKRAAEMRRDTTYASLYD
jgi:hypothetical protein